MLNLAGYIYILSSGDGYYSIRKCRDLKAVYTPESTKLTHTIQCENMDEAEADLFYFYKNKQVSRHWFRLDGSDLIDLQQIFFIPKKSDKHLTPPRAVQKLHEIFSLTGSGLKLNEAILKVFPKRRRAHYGSK